MEFFFFYVMNISTGVITITYLIVYIWQYYVD